MTLEGILKRLALSCLVAAAEVLSACSSTTTPAPPHHEVAAVTVTLPAPPPAPPPPPDDPAPEPPPPVPVIEWRVGAYLPLSGSESQFGVETKEGIELAVDQVNAAGGVRGRYIHVVYADDKSSPAEAVNKVLELIDRDNVIALLGELASSISKAGGIVANRRQIPMISPGSTNPEVTRVGPFVFRACFIDPVQAKAAARFLVRTKGKKKLALLFASDALYSAGLASVFRDEVKQLGAQMVIEQSFLRTETNFATYLKAIRATRPDMVYAPLYFTSMIPIARQAKAMGLSGSVFMGGDGWDTTTILDGAGAELQGATFTGHFAIDAPGDQIRAFVTAYRQRFQHDPSSLGALGYDAAQLLADAIKRTSNETPGAIREAIQATRDFRGVTGKISIDADRNADKDVIVVRIDKGRFVYHATAN